MMHVVSLNRRGKKGALACLWWKGSTAGVEGCGMLDDNVVRVFVVYKSSNRCQSGKKGDL